MFSTYCEVRTIVMNILAINNLKNSFQINKQEKKDNVFGISRFGIKMPAPISQDTVSFKSLEKGAKLVDATAKKVRRPRSSGITMVEIFEHIERKKEPKLIEASTVFLDILESIAIKLAPYGVSFDRDYCEKSPVKSIKSKMSKLFRQKSLDIRDGGVRSTLFSKNIYDLSVLNDLILPEMIARGFKLDKIDVTMEEAAEKGYIPTTKNKKMKNYVSIYDLDIRLAGANKDKEKLDPKYRYCISKPQKSGYEDIQMRFKKGGILYELIILCGPNYAKAKEFESHEIYSHLREFDEMNIFRNFKENNEHSILADRYSTMIKNMIRKEISQNLFENAKNKDIYGIQEEISIGLNDSDKESLTKLFKLLHKEINEFYNSCLNNIRGYAFVQERFDEDRKKDLQLLNKINKGINDTVKFFDEQKSNSSKKTNKA